ncbi:ketopantoate reductase family protein [Vitiosangium sp. GDMCC 1.1324]|uniref:ketopantoate reductase family protein n=1 Tax=Vitiosangium sp. (strain GDMCC 1.1324) TaxID=2138576 RepID=UPI000D383702|nr:2-dehydropantoate 2-reductase N-terminal domain-containing protein [Vitiosangium sp. GDMCC 1.1324]PTL77457.1 2-dehydropantoate 2-reductase [Vitiosangium sp. GDMCC 1.1324]
MKIAIVGPGSIGSTFAFHLARAGHDVTVVARGARLARLEKDRAIVTTDDRRAPVEVSAALDTTTPWDLVLVTVLESQVDAVLPTLQQSAAKQVMFMFNTFAPFDRLRDVVGANRFVFGFPAILAELKEGRLKAQVVPRSFAALQITIVTDPAWAETFSKAGIPTDTQADMHSWLRTHAALVVPLMIVGNRVHNRGSGLSWKESREIASGMAEGFSLVRSLGHPLTPSNVGVFSKLLAPLVTVAMWLMSRHPVMAIVGGQGPGEARTLLDGMVAAAPTRTAMLQSLRP